MKAAFKVSAVFIGTIIGAGLASGQEILQFFSLYGINGFYGIFLCCVLYILFSFMIITLCFKFRFKSYREIIQYVFGGRLGGIVNLLTTFFIFSGNVIMLSGGGAMLNEYIGINKFWGTLIMILLAFAVTFYSTKGIVATNSIIVPFSTLIILTLGILVITTYGKTALSFNEFSFPIKQNWIWSAIIYSSFNIMGATGVLCPMICEATNKKQFIKGCIIGGIVLTLLALSINYSILYYMPKSFHFEIPNLYISKHYGNLLPFALTIIIWLEMFSTEIGDLYSLSKALQHSVNISYTNSLLLITFISLPFTFIGFSSLIKLLYPAFGVLSLFFIIGCFNKYLKLDIKS
jgi:uncharacterized membrane protein YkvI